LSAVSERSKGMQVQFLRAAIFSSLSYVRMIKRLFAI
jgi:hypothetical protein